MISLHSPARAKMKDTCRHLICSLLCSQSLLAFPAHAEHDTAAIPKHLALARELVENIKPENNHYRLASQAIAFPDDFLSSGYSVQADCSGFLLALFDRAKYTTQARMSQLNSFPRRSRPAAEDFVFSIENGKGYERIRHVEDILPGDVLAHAMLNLSDQRQTGTTGHVMLIDSPPRAIVPRDPIIDGTRQFELTIIDVNEEYLGVDDSRLADPANKTKGLGRGTLRIYADAVGDLVGYARTFRSGNKFFSYDPRFPSGTKLRKAAIGRPVAAN